MIVKIQINEYMNIMNNIDESKMVINVTNQDGRLESSVAVNIDDLRCAIRKLVAK